MKRKRTQTYQPPDDADVLVRKLPTDKTPREDFAELIVEGQAASAKVVQDWSEGVMARAPIVELYEATAKLANRAAREAGRRWAELMRRAFGFDVLACSRCGGRLRLIAVLDASDVTQRILRHLGLPTEVSAARPARAPPVSDDAA